MVGERTVSSRTSDEAIAQALLRYRVLAYVVGVMLVVVVFVALPLNHWGDVPQVSDVVSPIHGFLYIVYLVAAFDLARKARFTGKGTALVVLAGVVTFLSFWAERRVTARVRAGQPL